MRGKAISLGITGLLVAGCAFTPAQLNTHAARYNGKTVVVRGFVELTRGAHVLYEPGAPHRELHSECEPDNCRFDLKNHPEYCVTIANPELLRKNSASVNAKTMTFQGKFVDNYRSQPIDF